LFTSPLTNFSTNFHFLWVLSKNPQIYPYMSFYKNSQRFHALYAFPTEVNKFFILYVSSYESLQKFIFHALHDKTLQAFYPACLLAKIHTTFHLLQASNSREFSSSTYHLANNHSILMNYASPNKYYKYYILLLRPNKNLRFIHLPCTSMKSHKVFITKST